MLVKISNDQFKKRFDINLDLQTVPNGDFSNILIATDNILKTQVLLKTVGFGVDPRPKPSGRLGRRISSLRHPNILPVLEHLFVEPQENNPNQVGFEVYLMEYVENGAFGKYSEKLSHIAEKERLINSFLNSLEVLHDQGIVHGNLKPGNVLVQDIGHPHVRLADFGWVAGQSTKEAQLTHPIHSIAYLAPEQLLDEKVGYNTDFWAFGMLVFELFTGKYIFGDFPVKNGELITRILAADLPKELENIPRPYSELIKACLTRDRSKRPKSTKDLRSILSGEKIWENGKLSTPPPAPPLPIYCYHCNTSNPAGSITCSNCAKALLGPTFLGKYKSNNSRAVWTIIWFTFLLLPLAFFYFGLHQTISRGSTKEIIEEKIEDVIVFYLKHQDQIDQNNMEDIVITILTLIVSYFIVFGSLWYLYFTKWVWRASNNLEALGSLHRDYHPSFMFLFAITWLPILQEIWRGSNPSYLVEGINWKRFKGSFLVLSWYLLSLVFPILVFLPLLPHFSYDAYMAWFYLTTGIILTYYLLTIIMLTRINLRQSFKYAAWAKQGAIVSRRP